LAKRSSASRPSPARFEAADVPSLLPLWLAAGLAGFVIVVVVSISVAYPLADHQEFRGPTQALPPAPRLQVAPGRDHSAYQVSGRQALDRSGTPIDAAIRATVAQGWGPPR
jgi:hypothetical protein